MRSTVVFNLKMFLARAQGLLYIVHSGARHKFALSYDAKLNLIKRTWKKVSVAPSLSVNE